MPFEVFGEVKENIIGLSIYIHLLTYQKLTYAAAAVPWYVNEYNFSTV